MSQTKLTMAALNALDADRFTEILGGIFEHSPWVPRAACAARPFASLDSLHATMVEIVDHAEPEQKLALLCAHPELARRATLTAASAAEQGSKGLDRLDADEAAQFDALNTAYRSRFGFPFIIAVRGQRDRAAILAALSRRVAHSNDQERATALAEVAKIARFRLEDMIKPDGYLTVHALDTATGLPAAGLPLTLYRISDDQRSKIGMWQTNADGRCDSPLLSAGALQIGTYEIIFDVEGWRGGAGDPGFYDLIPIRFRITDPASHYHIPLLLSPYGYTTYRGS